jgi:hypothetical protein
MTTSADVLALASSMVGYKEQPINRTYFGDWYSNVDHFHDEWCAAFVSYCFYTSGMPLAAHDAKGFVYCPEGAEWFRRNGAFHAAPRVGDVVFFDWYKGCKPCTSPEESKCSDAWHVGIVEKVLSDNSIVSIEGNMNDGVSRKTRNSDVWYGFGRPAYDNVHYVSDIPKCPSQLITLCQPPLSSQQIAIWKHQMVKRGFHFTGSENMFDENTQDVLRRFQQEKHLEVDGKLGPMSWRAAWELPVVG